MPIGLIKMKKQIKQFIFILLFSLFAIVQYAHGRVVLSESMPTFLRMPTLGFMKIPQIKLTT